MNIVYLKYAAAVAKAGSLSKAAEELAVAQPNLSRAIKELEKELDITIFDRKPKGIVLTPDGERLLSRGRLIIRDIEKLETEFKNKGGEKAVFSLPPPAPIILPKHSRGFPVRLRGRRAAKRIIKKPTRCARFPTSWKRSIGWVLSAMPLRTIKRRKKCWKAKILRAN